MLLNVRELLSEEPLLLLQNLLLSTEIIDLAIMQNCYFLMATLATNRGLTLTILL